MVVTYGLHDAAKALRDIRDMLSEWKERGGGGLRVFTRDGDARDTRDIEEFRKRQQEP
jgi:hypothetical protein